jgi:hypothetical protein
MQRPPPPRIIPHNPIEDTNRPIRASLHPSDDLLRRNHPIQNLNLHSTVAFAIPVAAATVIVIATVVCRYHSCCPLPLLLPLPF